MAEGEGVEPSRRIARPGFQDQLRATARHLPNLAGTPGFEPRISGLESDGLPLAYAPKMLGACGRTRTYEVVRRLIYSQVLLLLSHTCKYEFQISNLDEEDFRSGIRCAKKIDEGRENNAANTLRGTLLLRWRSPGTLAKDRDRHPLNP